ncbi:SMI1/KNR4 family protein [Luteibacter sp. RCC_6_2]|uniref:SMI1/KNR4 family protein n=1 Tax=Luteibacter sp. RCC_6_2 TaxID=3239223 RepID=UPI0035267A5A
MANFFVYDKNILPAGFSLPEDYLCFLHDDNLADVDPWWFLGVRKESAEFWIHELARQYPGRSLVPFARLAGSDDVACFDGSDLSGNPRVLYIHAFASQGWEDRGVECDFSSWLRSALSDHERHHSDSKN